jgi:hypothetical protein
MTQSPYGETASPKFAQGSGSDFGATTISGTPASTTATEQRSGSGSTTRPEDTNYRQSGAQQASRTSSAAAAAGRPARARGPRRARLQLRHISPLTVLKFSCVLAIALFFVWLIIVGVLYGILDAAGVVENVNSAYTNLSGPGTKAPITAGIVFGGAAIIGVVNIILFVALTTIGSVIYNLCADLVGGIEITLSER